MITRPRLTMSFYQVLDIASPPERRPGLLFHSHSVTDVTSLAKDSCDSVFASERKTKGPLSSPP